MAGDMLHKRALDGFLFLLLRVERLSFLLGNRTRGDGIAYDGYRSVFNLEIYVLCLVNPPVCSETLQTAKVGVGTARVDAYFAGKLNRHTLANATGFTKNQGFLVHDGIPILRVCSLLCATFSMKSPDWWLNQF